MEDGQAKYLVLFKIHLFLNKVQITKYKTVMIDKQSLLKTLSGIFEQVDDIDM